ncbi:MAG: 2-phosphosulfolactate phosphatase [Alcanivoracaceae bacterium]|nr:2-phosphosulfolactate phosphatase [Alcanivoracaceae bacterium]
MEVLISQGHFPPANPDGITVVIDVIRAFTTAHFAFEGGASRIYLVATAPEALAMKATQPDLLLAGEIDALPIDGFDFSNSPWEIQNTPLTNRELVQRTTNGVIATLRARDSAEVLVAGLINAEATAAYILSKRPSHVVLVASHPTGDEDVACAEYIRGLLGGDGVSLTDAVERTLNAKSAGKFFDGSHPRLRADDIRMAATTAGSKGRVMAVSYAQAPCITAL